MDAQQSQAGAGGSGRRRDEGRSEARVAAMLAAHGDALRRVARRYSGSTDDADDAVQRALEIYIRRLARLDPATEDKWLKVVVKHEALAVRRSRGSEALAGDEIDLDARPATDQRPLEDLLAGRERAGRVAEALRRIKPDEARAMLLKADGLSYDEIARRMGWSYTKVNRCLAEGRKHFLEAYAEIEDGSACARFAPALDALAAGRAGAAALLELRPHLRNCSACRAAVRGLHVRRRARLAALAPVPWLHALMQRLPAVDVAAGTQLMAGGGGRAAALGAVAAGVCLGGAPCVPERAPEPRTIAAEAGADADAVAAPTRTPAQPQRVIARPVPAGDTPRKATAYAFEPVGGRDQTPKRRDPVAGGGGGFERGGASSGAAGFERGDRTAPRRRDAASGGGGGFERGVRDEPPAPAGEAGTEFERGGGAEFEGDGGAEFEGAAAPEFERGASHANERAAGVEPAVATPRASTAAVSEFGLE